MTWQASWPPTQSRHEDRQPPNSNSSGVLGSARRGRGTVGDDLASGRTTLRLTPTSDQSIGRRQRPGPGAATGLQPRRHPGRRPEAPGRPRPRRPTVTVLVTCTERSADRPSAASGTTALRTAGVRHRWLGLVSMAMPVSAAICRPGRMSGHRPHAGHQCGHGSSPVAPGTWKLMRRTARTQVRNRCYRRPRPPQMRCPWSVSGPHGHPSRPCQNRSGSAANTAGHFPSWPPGMPSWFRHRGRPPASAVRPAAAVATGTGRRGGGHWWDAATAGGRDQARRSGARGAARGHRSSPAG